MSQNDKYIPEEEEIVEEEKKGLSEKTLKIALGVVIAALVVVVVVAVILFSSGSNEETTTAPNEETTVAEEITTDPADRYTPGKYTVNVGEGLTLNFRKSFEKDAELYTEAIPNGKELVITEIKYIPTADEAFRYMGKTTYSVNYELCEGWVAMFYLSNAYSSSIVTPGEVTTGEPEQTTVAPEQTTTASTIEQTTAAPVQEQTTAAPVQEQTTAAPQVNTGKATTPGTYTIDVDPDPGHVRMRSDHSVDSENITLIPAGEKVIVTDVYEDANASDSTLKYWGKVEYAGYTGWIAMWYLK